MKTAVVGSAILGSRGAGAHVAQDIPIAHALWHRSVEQIGKTAAALSVLIVAERQSRGEVRSMTQNYLGGMLKASRRGEFNIGMTIWGYREATAL